MKRVILTGGSGFVGANLARRLLADGHEVHLFLRPGFAAWRVADILEHVHAHEVDLSNKEQLSATVRGIRPEWVFHLATYGAYPAQTHSHLMVRTNVFGTMNLLNACLQSGFEAFINAGSSSEYGWKDHAPPETEVLEPNSDYAVTKASATHFCSEVAAAKQVNVSTLRLYSVYGPFEEPSRLIPTLISFGLRGQLPALANPDIARDFVYVDDVVDAFLLVANAKGPGEIYNVGTGTQTTLREAVAVAQKVLKLEVEPAWETMRARSWDTNVWVADSEKIRERVGWRPRFDFESGFYATAEWFRKHPEMLLSVPSALFPLPLGEG